MDGTLEEAQGWEIRLIEPDFTKAEFREKLIDVYCDLSVTEHPASERIDKIMELVWPLVQREPKRESIDPQIMSSWLSGDDDTRLLLARLKLVGKYQRIFDGGASA